MEKWKLIFTWKSIHKCSALFIIALNQKLQSPLTGNWLNKLWYIHTMKYYSGIKRNKLLICMPTWMNLWRTTHWVKKAKRYTLYDSIFTAFLKPQNNKWRQISDCWSWGVNGGRMEVNVAIKGQHEGSFGNGNVPHLHCIYVKILVLIL